MDYKEIYNAALERAAKLRVQNPFDTVGQMVEHIFPELQESKDEVIRKAIISCCIDHGHNYQFPDITAQDMLAWLEKQGEQTHAALGQSEVTKTSDQELEPKFHPGDWVIDNFGNTYQIESATEIIAEHIFGYTIVGGGYFNDNSHVRLWSIQDAKDGDLIYVSTEEKGIQAIFHEYKNDTIFFHCYLCADFAQGGYMPIGSVELTYPLQKTHYNRFFEKMHKAGYEWDAEKKVLKKIMQKLDPDKVIEWLNDQACQGWIEDVEVDKFVDKFKEDFGL